MAEKKNPINYGESEATRMQAAAEAYATSSAQSVADLEQSYKDKVNELAKGIVTGMTQQEKDLLEKQVQDLGNRYSQAISATQGQFAFAQQQAQTTAAAMADQYAAMQDAQRALAEQTLGAASTQTLPGGLTAAQRDAMLQAQQTGAANLAYLGGAGAVPEQLLSPEQRTATGVMGVAGLARSLYAQSLEAQRAASRAQLEGSRVNLQTALEARALESAMAREQKERDRLREFELTGFNAVLAAKQERDNKMAELLAAAASADTRTEKDKALAELDMYKKKANIDLNNQLKIIGAQAKASGATQVSQAVNDMQAEVKGSSSVFGQNLAAAIANRPQGRPANAAEMVAKGTVPRMYGIKGIPGILYMSGSSMLVHEQDVADPTKTQYYDLTNLNRLLTTTSGYLQNEKLSKDQQLLAVRRMLQAATPQEKIAIQYLFGFDSPELLLVALKPLPGATAKVSTKPRQKAVTALESGMLGYGTPLYTTKGGTPTTTPNPNPTPNAKPTPKK